MSEKNALQEYCQKQHLTLPAYKVEERGPSHQREFLCTVIVSNQPYSMGQWAGNKKEAEKLAAAYALAQLQGVKPNVGSSTDPLVGMLANLSLESKAATIRASDISGPPATNHISLLNQVHQKKGFADKLPEFLLLRDPDSEDHAPLFGGSMRLLAFDNKELKVGFKYPSRKEVQQYLSLEALKFIHEKETSVSKNVDQTRSQRVVKTFTKEEALPPPKVHSTPRAYQLELYFRSMKENTICCLPTGAGKTLIGCLILAKMKEKNPKKKILFLVDRIPLVFQQADLIERETNLRAIRCCGDNFTPAHLVKEYDVMVCIASLFINILEKKLLTLNDFSLIIIDEAHHTTKEHPFAVILKEYYPKLEEDFRPKVVGLTASPAGDVDFFSTLLRIKVLAKTAHASAVMPIECAGELQMYVTNESMTIEEIPLDQREQLLTDFTKYCMDEAKLWDITTDDLMRGVLEEEMNELEESEEAIPLYNSASQLNNQDDLIEGEEIVFATPPPVVEISPEKFCQRVAKFCAELLDFGRTTTIKLEPIDYIDVLTKDLDIVKLAPEAKGKINDRWVVTANKLRALEQASIRQQTKKEEGEAVSKLDKLFQVLKQHPNRKDFQTIIFVQTRESAMKLLKYLQNYSKEKDSSVQPEVVTGHNSKREGGMSITNQKKVIHKFKRGDANVLIGTSVIEEGFNVPECNLVIRLDAPSTVTALVQSRGRLRKMDSKFVAIVKTSDIHQYEKLRRQEEALKAAVYFIQFRKLPEAYQERYDQELELDLQHSIQKVEEMCQKAISAGFPDMKIQWLEREISGASHAPTFTIDMILGGKPFFRATGNSKTAAREKIAKTVLKSMALLMKLAADSP